MKHTPDCNMVFGRKDPTCPRCRELLAGAPARGWDKTKKVMEARRLEAIRNHDCKKSGCGPVCTAFDY